MSDSDTKNGSVIELLPQDFHSNRSQGATSTESQSVTSLNSNNDLRKTTDTKTISMELAKSAPLGVSQLEGTEEKDYDKTVIDEETDVVPLLKYELKETDMKTDSQGATVKTFRTMYSDTAATMVDSNAVTIERVDIETHEPQEADPTLDSPKFKPDDFTELTKVLNLDHSRMTAKQKDQQRNYVCDFVAYYTPMNVFKDTPSLQYSTSLIDLLFEKVTDDKHPALDKIFSLLTILSRNVKTKGPNNGAETRVTKIIETLRHPTTSHDVNREALRSLINYAEVNAKFIEENKGLDALLLLFTSHMQDPSFLVPLLWTMRNLTVTEHCRKKILEKQGFLVVNAMSANIGEADVVEQACWTLGNLALADDFGGIFTAIGVIPTVKSILATHIEHEKVVEAALWVIFNAGFDGAMLKSYLRMGLEESLINSLKKYSENKKIVEWAEISIKRIRAAIQSSTPQAIAERNANKIIRSGNLFIRGGVFNSWKSKFFILQPQRLTFSDKEDDSEIDGEIKLRDVIDISAEGQQIKLSTRTKPIILDLKNSLAQDVENWLNDLKASWKSAVCAVTETPLSPNDKPSGFQGFQHMFAMPENIAEKDVEKSIMAAIFHEIYSHPRFLTKNFSAYEKQNPNLSAWDYVATKAAIKLGKKLLEKKNDFKLADKDFYDLEKIKKEAEHLIDKDLMQEVAEFEKDPKFEDAPKIITRYEYCAKQGIRPTMEDRHIHLPYIDLLVERDPKDEPVSYYAVYDGHGGINVAAWVEMHLHYNILTHPSFNEDPKKAIVESFTKTQDELKEHSERLYQPGTAGSTAVTIIFKGKQMIVSWAGDSLASIFTRKKDFELVDPHKPTKASEKARIEGLGGFVNEEAGVMRVNGAVAVSRAFGNIRHRVINPEADVVIHQLTGDEEYVVIACDGLWDVMTTQDVRKFVKKYMRKNGKRTKGISEALVDEALKLGSTDNVSVIFVEFNWWKEPKRA